jgi:hypothetical protein
MKGRHGVINSRTFRDCGNNDSIRVITGFRCDLDEICALFGYYVALRGSSVRTFRDNLSVPTSRVKKSKFLDFLTLEDGIDSLSRNFGTELPRKAA